MRGTLHTSIQHFHHPTQITFSTHHPRICVQLYAYAWPSYPYFPTHCPVSTHMRATLHICVETSFQHHASPPTYGMSTHRPLLCTAFNEELYNSIVKNKKVIAECCIDLDEDEYPEVKEQISLRGWRRLAAPKQEISIDLIHEFYANAILTEEEMEEAGGHTFRSYVRGKVVDFSPENLRNVMRFRAHVQGAATYFETRKEHDQQLDQVIADLCIPGATWKLRVPIQLRRQELNPVARGWHEFSIHSLIPSSNRSKIPVIRAILIHCIMRGEDVRAEDIIADKIVRMAHGIKKKGKLGFPSTIYKLCKEAGVPLREFRRIKKIQAEKPIIAKRMESTRLPRPVQRRQQEDEEEDEPIPQAEEGNEEGNEGQAHDYDYHHQPEYEHQ
ncbi:hypothetical protein PIB30_074169 [Stylosanthes scabra]|uniref:Putative plant transposon protein domain-containing protein n=1 Tax=Stylosanthes scabra TaxID=79078 RepID=A0ABU6XMJ6_9FABA|nr:hypothetical protein [Stylosanthes scabra]